MYLPVSSSIEQWQCSRTEIRIMVCSFNVTFGDIFMCQISIAYDHNDFVFEIHLNLLFALEIIHCKEC